MEAIVGSGILYVTSYTEGSDIPSNGTIEVASNILGEIKGGASVECKATPKTIENDFGKIIKQFIEKEECSFKTGILTFNMESLNKLILNGEVDTSGSGSDILYIGGRNRKNLERYIIHFVHELDDSRKLRITIVGSSNGDFKFEFKPDDGTIIDSVFTAIPHDEDGTLVKIEMDKIVVPIDSTETEETGNGE